MKKDEAATNELLEQARLKYQLGEFDLAEIQLDHILETVSEHGEDAPRHVALAAERLPVPQHIY